MVGAVRTRRHTAGHRQEAREGADGDRQAARLAGAIEGDGGGSCWRARRKSSPAVLPRRSPAGRKSPKPPTSGSTDGQKPKAGGSGRNPDGRNCRRHLAGIPAQPWARVFLCQPRHGFPGHRRRLCPRETDGRQGAPIGAGAARKSRGRHGARRLSHDGDAASGDGPRQCWHRQHHQPARQCRARPGAAAVDGRAFADHGSGCVWGAQPAHPLGAGDVRPGRHGP